MTSVRNPSTGGSPQFSPRLFLFLSALSFPGRVGCGEEGAAAPHPAAGTPRSVCVSKGFLGSGQIPPYFTPLNSSEQPKLLSPSSALVGGVMGAQKQQDSWASGQPLPVLPLEPLASLSAACYPVCITDRWVIWGVWEQKIEDQATVFLLENYLSSL